jgi:NADH-quinone oxidoreductase subunit H
LSQTVVVDIVRIAVILGMFLGCVAYLVWVERKLLGHIQIRVGPKRVGPYGLLQPIADFVKLVSKEDLTPPNAHRALFRLAPAIALVPAILSIAVIPFGGTIRVLGREMPIGIADINVGLLYVFAMSSMGVFGIALAGWSSNNKYSLMGGLRSSAQLISYEVSLGLSVLGVVLLAGTFSLREIVAAQHPIPFVALQPVGFLLFLMASSAEIARIPFDLPEAETELVAGFHTEYSSMKFAMFFVAEYANLVTVSAMAVTLFLGGWNGPFLPGPIWFALKTAAMLFLFIWVRGTLPRYRYDQLMRFGWKFLLPVALLNLLVTALIVALSGGEG